MNSIITAATTREIELLACLEATLVKLAEATNYIAHLGGCSEAIREFADRCTVSHYLEQHDIIMVDTWKIVEPEFNCPVS